MTTNSSALNSLVVSVAELFATPLILAWGYQLITVLDPKLPDIRYFSLFIGCLAARFILGTAGSLAKSFKTAYASNVSTEVRY